MTQFLGLSRPIGGFYLSTVLIGVPIVLNGCGGGGNSDGGYAPSSLVGKTMQVNKWLASVTFSTSNEARPSFGSCIGTCAENGKTTGDFDLTLDFTSANYGTANGGQSYTFVNYESNKTSDTDNVLSDSPFTLTGS